MKTENEINMLMLELNDLGIKYVYVNYSGGGDEGAVDGIYAVYEFDKMNTDTWNWKTDSISTFISDETLTFELPKNLKDKVDELLYKIILNDIEDWYNNDGGYGYVVISVPSGDYIVQNNIYYTTTDTYEHQENLIVKALES